ncbi:hypothetical protein CC2G_011964 [Coprinopsis cinerea AmutBmut pab1-1]|nr:hypothetical protein CC2G_011964 [Coprinopsis cinerea AmutBmut pab1-1]
MRWMRAMSKAEHKDDDDDARISQGLIIMRLRPRKLRRLAETGRSVACLLRKRHEIVERAGRFGSYHRARFQDIPHRTRFLMLDH